MQQTDQPLSLRSFPQAFVAMGPGTLDPPALAWQPVRLANDEDCQLLSGSYMDYLLPTADEVPPIEVGHQVFLSELNPFGIKGCGEGGAVSPPAAIANAVVDALRPLEVNVNHVPLRPEALLRLIQQAQAGSPHGGTKESEA